MKGRILLLVAAFGLIAALALPAGAQGWKQDHRSSWQDRDHDRDNHGNNSRAYQDGYRDGQRDRGKRSHPRGSQWKGNDRDAYNAGYRAGFNQRGGMAGDRDRDRDRDRNDRGAMGGGYAHGGNQAYRNGYTQGLNYGRHDAQGRKAYRPTDSQMVQDGTNGYNRSYGSVDQYKRDFRQGYQEGYQRGYYGR